jgi:hypothetical protein
MFITTRTHRAAAELPCQAARVRPLNAQTVVGGWQARDAAEAHVENGGYVLALLGPHLEL